MGEHLGTKVSTSEYLREKGVFDDHAEVDNHELKVRTKTFKMVNGPTLEELTCEVEMLLQWLPMMVNKDSSFDVVIDDLADLAQVKQIEAMLAGTEEIPS